MNEAGIDVVANRILGYGIFDKNSNPSPLAVAALTGDRDALRKLVKIGIRAAAPGNLPLCDGWCFGEREVTHIGSKGYAYCGPCALCHRESSYERTRRMRPWELALLREGKPLPSYTPRPKGTS